MAVTSRFPQFLQRLTAFSDVACLRRFWCVVFFVPPFLEKQKLTRQTHPIRKLTCKDSIDVLTNLTNSQTRQTQFTENHNQNNKEDNEGLAERPKRTSPGEKEAFEASETPPGSELRGPSAPGGFQAGSGSCSRAAGLVFSGGGSAGGSWGQVSRRRHAPTDRRGFI